MSDANINPFLGELATLERQINETHQYIRHTFQILVTWFTVFISINYASMGWLAKDETHTRGLLIIIAIMFITQNALGISAIVAIRQYMQLANAKLRRYEEEAAALANRAAPAPVIDTGMPIELYPRVLNLMKWGLVSILVAWLLLPIPFYWSP